jgi:hypothetical protein
MRQIPMKPQLSILSKAVLALLPLIMNGCLPSYHLQQFSARLLTSPGAIQIEQGRKDLSMELSGSFSGSRGESPIPGSEGSYYDPKTFTPDGSATNCAYRTAAWQADLYCAILGKRLVCGKFESQLGLIEGKMYYNFTTGIGARLYRGNLAGRVWCSAGIAKARCDAYVLERNNNAGSYDLRDSYDDNLPFAELSAAFNTISPTLAVNPYVNVSVRYYSLFRYDDIAVRLVPVYLAAGIYKNFGPLTASCGLRLNAYDSNRLFTVHTMVTGQLTLHL